MKLEKPYRKRGLRNKVGNQRETAHGLTFSAKLPPRPVWSAAVIRVLVAQLIFSSST